MVELATFPDGCGGCRGACCVTVGGFPPFEFFLILGLLPKPCVLLTTDGLCSDYQGRPEMCRSQAYAVGGQICTEARHG